MKKFERLMAKPWAAYTFAACCAVCLYMLLKNVSVLYGAVGTVLKLLSPVVTGVITAYLFNPLVDFFEKKCFKKIKKESARHLLSVAVTALCLILFLALLLLALIPSLAKSIANIINNWSFYTEKLEGVLAKLSVFLNEHNIKVDLSNFETLVDNALDKLITLVKDNAKTILSTAGTVGAGVSNFVIGVVFGFCFLIAKAPLLKMLGKLRAAFVRQERIERNNDVFLRCHRVFIRYVGCTLLDAVIIGVAVLIFTLICRMSYGPLIAVVCAVTNIIPTFGPMIGAAIGIFFLILEKPLHALLFFIFICILQAIDGMVIKPKLFSGSLGIPAVWTLVLLIIGGKFAGMAGIILAVPVAAILVILYQEHIRPRLESRAERINAEPPEEDELPPYPTAEKNWKSSAEIPKDGGN